MCCRVCGVFNTFTCFSRWQSTQTATSRTQAWKPPSASSTVTLARCYWTCWTSWASTAPMTASTAWSASSTGKKSHAFRCCVFYVSPTRLSAISQVGFQRVLHGAAGEDGHRAESESISVASENVLRSSPPSTTNRSFPRRQKSWLCSSSMLCYILCTLLYAASFQCFVL